MCASCMHRDFFLSVLNHYSYETFTRIAAAAYCGNVAVGGTNRILVQPRTGVDGSAGRNRIETIR